MIEPSVFSLNSYPNPNKIYTIVPIFAQDMAIDINRGDTKPNTKVQLWKKHNGPNQKFKFILNNELNCSIESLHCSNRALDVKSAQVKNGNDIFLWEKNGTKAQYFRLVKNNDESYTFLSSLNYNYVIDVKGRNSNNGADIILYERNHTEAQKFKLIGKNILNNALEYALKYSVKPNPKYKIFKSNGANFWSQCLYAGGEDTNDLWNKNSDVFTNGELMRNYFIEKGIEWKENAKIEEANPGDIIYTKIEKNEFSFPVFFISNLKKGFVYCGNNSNIENNKGILNMKIVPGFLGFLIF